ncbi:MAG: ABC transporter permease [Chloroflexota bacterium]|nr:ABC transporter permease [Chloroflexota bacterium]
MYAQSILTQLRRQFSERPRPLSLRWLLPVVMPLALLLLWQLVVMLELYPSFIIPAPLSVWETFVEVLSDGRLLMHTSVTLTQTLAGLLIGATAGMVLGYAIAKSANIDALLSPIIVALQSTPVVAYAPLLVIWFGSGITSKIITSALIVFFPMLLNTVVGLRSVPPDLRDVLRLVNASRLQLFTQLEAPYALPTLLGGLKVSATLAVIGSVVGEFVSASAGLGWFINDARYNYDTPRVFVTVLTLALIARLLYGAVTVLETRFLKWQKRSLDS